MKLLLISRGVLAVRSDQLASTLSPRGDQWRPLRAAVNASPSLPFHLARPKTTSDVQTAREPTLLNRPDRCSKTLQDVRGGVARSFMSHSSWRSSFSQARFVLRSQRSRHMLTVAPQTRVPGPVCRQAVMTQLAVLLQMEAIMAPRKYFWKNDCVLTAGAAGCNRSVIEVP